MLPMQRNVIFLFLAAALLSLSACGGYGGDARHVISSEYDTSGNLISEASDSNGDGKADVFVHLTYDADGHLIETTQKDGDGNLQERSTATYNTLLDKLLKTTSEHYGDRHSFSESDWEYDAAGSLMKSTEIEEVTENGKTSKKIFTFTYDTDGNQLRMEVDSDGDGIVDWVKVSLYNQPECDVGIDLEDDDNDGVFDHKFNHCTGQEIF
jgi:hypothetical protein